MAGCRKRVAVKWQTIDRRLRAVDGLDDVMQFDINYLCRQMQPPTESHYR